MGSGCFCLRIPLLLDFDRYIVKGIFAGGHAYGWRWWINPPVTQRYRPASALVTALCASDGKRTLSTKKNIRLGYT